MALVRPFRTLILTTPPMKGGRDIMQVQSNLNSKLSSYGVKLLVDGEYGPATASAVAKWKYYMGFPKPNNGIAITGQRQLIGLERVPIAYRALALLRRKLYAQSLVPTDVAKKMRLQTMALMRLHAKNGVKESPAGSNRVPVLQQLAATLGLAQFYRNMGWPWCIYCIYECALKFGSKTADYALRKGAFNGLYTVDVLDKALAGRFNMRVVGKSERQPGDIALINFPGGDARVDHAVIFIEAAPNGYIRTVEGNTSMSGSQDNGGAFHERADRHESIVRAYIRYE